MKRTFALTLIVLLMAFLISCGSTVNTDVSDKVLAADTIVEAARIAVEEGRQTAPSEIQDIRLNPGADILNIELIGTGKTVSQMHGEARIVFERLKLREYSELTIVSYWFAEASGRGTIQGMRIEFSRSDFRNTNFEKMLPHELPDSATEYFIHHEISG
jgi:hypothetical protein